MPSNFHKQIDAACVQLDRAIILLIDEGDYYWSATSADAAEEIFGKIATVLSKSSALETICETFERMLSPEELEAFGKAKGLRASLNEHRNWLKHYQEENTEFYFDVESVARDLVDRAIDSPRHSIKSNSKQIERFYVYASGRYNRGRIKTDNCPRCGKNEGLPIFWGQADEETWKAAQSGELILGGYVTHEINANRECHNCDHQWLASSM